MSEIVVKNKEYPVEISVIMVTYNHQEYIQQAIEGVVIQEFQKTFELLIGDDASTDDTPQIVKKYYNRYPQIIVPVLREENLGASKNLYNLLKMARGKYLAFCEGDDFWIDINKLQVQYDYLEEHGDVVAVFHKNNIVDRDGDIVDNTWDFFPHFEYHKKDYEKGRIPGHTSTMFIRNFLTPNIEEYRDVLTSHFLIGDRTVWMLCLAKGNIHCLDNRFSVYRKIRSKDGTNAVSILQKTNTLCGQLEYYDKLEKYCKEHNLSISFSEMKKQLFVNAVVRWLKTKKKEDKIVAVKIMNEGDNRISYLIYVIAFGVNRIIRKILGIKD